MRAWGNSTSLRRWRTRTALSSGSRDFVRRGAASTCGTSYTPHSPKAASSTLVGRAPEVLTGDSFFHLSALGSPLEGLNLCGAGRVVCLIDPVGDVYACPFVIHDEFLAGNVRPAVSRRFGAKASSFARCANRATPARARRVESTTRVAVGAWRPSSSPGSR